MTFTNWNHREPNDWGHGEDCTVRRRNGTWNDFRCNHPFHFICKFPPAAPEAPEAPEADPTVPVPVPDTADIDDDD